MVKSRDFPSGLPLLPLPFTLLCPLWLRLVAGVVWACQIAATLGPQLIWEFKIAPFDCGPSFVKLLAVVQLLGRPPPFPGSVPAWPVVALRRLTGAGLQAEARWRSRRWAPRSTWSEEEPTKCRSSPRCVRKLLCSPGFREAETRPLQRSSKQGQIVGSSDEDSDDHWSNVQTADNPDTWLERVKASVPGFSTFVRNLAPSFSPQFALLSDHEQDLTIASVLYGRNVKGSRVPLMTDQYVDDGHCHWESRRSTVPDDVLKTGVNVRLLQKSDPRNEDALHRLFFRKLKLKKKLWIDLAAERDGADQYYRTVDAVKLKKCNSFIILCRLLAGLTELSNPDFEICKLELLTLAVSTCPKEPCTLGGASITQRKTDLSCNGENPTSLYDRLLRTIGLAVEWLIHQIAKSISDESFFKTYSDVIMLSKHQQAAILAKDRWNSVVPKLRTIGRRFLKGQASCTPIKDLFCVVAEWLRGLLENKTLFEKTDIRAFSKLCDDWIDDPRNFRRIAREDFLRGRTKKELETLAHRLGEEANYSSGDESGGDYPLVSAGSKPSSAAMEAFSPLRSVPRFGAYRGRFLAGALGVKARDINRCNSCKKTNCLFCAIIGVLSDLTDAARHAKLTGHKFLRSTTTTVYGKKLRCALPFQLASEVS